MSKRITALKPNRTIEYGAGWHIDYDPNTREYLALMNDDVAIIGYAATRDDARELLFDYIDEQHKLNAALYATAKARGDRAEMDAQRARGAALVAELHTMIALADEAGGVYDEGE